jgi:hypothetical protein
MIAGTAFHPELTVMTELFVARARQCATKFRLGHDVEAALIMVDLFGELQPCFVGHR